MRNRLLRISSLLLTLCAVILFIIGIGLIDIPFGFDKGNSVQSASVSNALSLSSSAIDRPVLRVGVERNFPPYDFVKNGKLSGFDVDITEAISEEMGVEIEYFMAPPGELLSMLKEGELDAVAGVMVSPQREIPFDFSTPYASVSMNLFVRQDSPVRSLEDTVGLDLVVQQGGVLQGWLTEYGFSERVLGVRDSSDALMLLAGGQYDAALLPEMQGMYLIERLNLHQLRSIDIELAPYPYAFAVAGENKELVQRLNEGLTTISQTGEYDDIYQKWFGIYETRQISGTLRLFAIALLAALALLIGALAWTWMLRTQVRKATSRMRRSEEEYRLLVENASEGVMVVCDNRMVFLNPRAVELTGYERSELDGFYFSNLIAAEDRSMVIERHRNHPAEQGGKEQYSCRMVTSKGESRWILVNSVAIDWNGRPARLNLFSDISEIKQAEERISRQLDQMAALRAVDMAIAHSTDLQRTLRLLLEQVIRQLHVDAADVLLIDRETGALVHAADKGFRSANIKSARLEPGQGYAGAASAHRHPVFVTTLRGAPKELFSAKEMAVEGFQAYYGTPLIAKGEVLGVLEIYQRSQLPRESEWMDLVETMAHQAAIAIDEAALVEGLESANQELIQAYDRTIEGWARALELRDGETEGHAQRVTALTVELASRMGLSEEDLVHIRRGALLHDIGKMGIPDCILLKQGPLNDDEWRVMRKHPVYALEMLQPIEFLRPALAIPYAHHERWDGTGYPCGLRGRAIPLAARIFSVIDVWDALSVNRPYRDAWPEERVWAHIQAEAGKQFDPLVVDTFIAMMKNEDTADRKQRWRFRKPLAAD